MRIRLTKYILFFVFTISVATAISQDLIPNGGFEEFNYKPLKWNTSGADFSGILKNWNSPTQASPDAYGPGIQAPSFWKKQGFGFITPIEGKGFVGLTLYGCTEGKPHCREYLQARMSEPLVPGQQYELSFYVSPLPKGLRINNIGVAFSYDSIAMKLDRKIDLTPTSNIKKVVAVSPGKWVKAKLLFQAKAREKYILLGNFFADKETKTRKDPIYTKLKYAYYYFDDVRLIKIPPIIEYVDTTNVFLERTYDIDERVILENIYFDHDDISLLPKSYLTLSHLLELLQQYPNLKIQLVGHTDSDGSNSYNQRLSKRRARTVYHYLLEQGIATSRLSYAGEGERTPIATNDTEEGKSLNRRVEFRIIDQ